MMKLMIAAMVGLVAGCSAGEGPPESTRYMLVISTEMLRPDMKQSFNEAAQEWNTVCQDDLVFVTDKPWLYNVADAPELPAPNNYATGFASPTGIMVRSDAISMGPDVMRGIFAHEIGHHLLGNSHSPDENDIMYMFVSANPVRPQDCPR